MLLDQAVSKNDEAAVDKIKSFVASYWEVTDASDHVCDLVALLVRKFAAERNELVEEAASLENLVKNYFLDPDAFILSEVLRKIRQGKEG